MVPPNFEKPYTSNSIYPYMIPIQHPCSHLNPCLPESAVHPIAAPGAKRESGSAARILRVRVEGINDTK